MKTLSHKIREDVLNTPIPELTVSELIYIRTYQSLQVNSWNQERTSNELDVSVRTIRNYVRTFRKLGIEIPKYGSTFNDRSKEAQIQDS